MSDHAYDCVCDCYECTMKRESDNLRARIMELAIVDRDIRTAAMQAAKPAKSGKRVIPMAEIEYRYQESTIADHRDWNVSVYEYGGIPERDHTNSVAREPVTGDSRNRQYVQTTTAGMNRPDTEHGRYQARVDLWELGIIALAAEGIDPDWIRKFGPRCPKRNSVD